MLLSFLVSENVLPATGGVTRGVRGAVTQGRVLSHSVWTVQKVYNNAITYHYSLWLRLPLLYFGIGITFFLFTLINH